MTLIEWAGMTEEEKSEARAWSKEREKRSEEAKKLAQEKKDSEPDESDPLERERKYREHQEMKMKECRAGCGVKDASYRCSKCKEVRECGSLSSNII